MAAIQDDGLTLVVAVDTWIDETDLSTVSWKVFNNIDPSRDLKMLQNGNRLVVGIDATKKTLADGQTRPWPDDIEMSQDIIDLVSKRWTSYGID